jgi:PDZ domain
MRNVLWFPIVVLATVATTSTTRAFVVLPVAPNHCGTPATTTTTTTTTLHGAAGAVDLDTLSDIGYVVEVEKPMGVVFGENRAPFGGLSIDSVEEGTNGATAGLRVGDQLMAVNGKSVIGADFDNSMSLLKDSPSPLALQVYRGTIKSLFTIVLNRRGDEFVPEEEESEVTDEVVFDENYESPVIMSAEEFVDDTISVSQVASDAAKNIGNVFSPTTIGGFFGKMFPQETIQLEDKDGK